MNEVIQYFQNIPSWHRIVLLAVGISLFWLLESAIPLFQFTYNKWKHAGVNIFFTVTTLVINFGFALLIVVKRLVPGEWFRSFTMDQHAGLVTDNTWTNAARSRRCMAYTLHRA